MSRMPYPDVATLSQAKRDIIDQFGPNMLNVSLMAMHAPDAQWIGQRTLGFANVASRTIAPRLKEYVVLIVAYLSGSAYELHHHRSIAANLGITEETMEALRVGDFSGLEPMEQAVCRFAVEVVRDVSPTDQTLAAVRAHLPDAQVIEIVCLVGSYMLTARIAAVSGADIEAEAVRDWSHVPPGR
jgi:4-carboxymuconolactone decarboxylase